LPQKAGGQLLLILAPRFNRPIGTGPMTAKGGREAQLGKTTGMITQQQRINQLKLSIPGPD
jgi:hypothetical protein